MLRAASAAMILLACAAPPGAAPEHGEPNASRQFVPTRTAREMGAAVAVEDGGADPASTGGGADRPELALESGRVRTLYETGGAGPTGLAGDAEHLYFANECSGTVVKLSKSGGAPEILADHQLRPTAVAADDTHVYFLSEGRLGKLSCSDGHELCSLDFTPRAKDGALVSVPKSGGKPRTLARGLHHPVHLAVDANVVLVAEAGSQRLIAVPKTKGPPRVLASTQEHISRIAVAPGAYYWSNGPLYRLRRGASDPELVDSYWTNGVSADGDHVYVHHADRLSRIRHGETEVSPVSPELGYFTPAIASDRQHVWWSHCARVSKAPLAGGRAVSVYAVDGTSCQYYRGGASARSSDEVAPRELLVDDGAVFWLENQRVTARAGEQYRCSYGGSVKRLEK